MPLRLIRYEVLAILILMCFWASTYAGDGCCAHCGCTANCRTVCRLVREEKKVEVVCWGCKCEEFCVAGPSKPGCKHCECVCTACDDKDADSTVCAKPKRFVWFDWLPGCAQVYTRTKLMKKTVTVTVPSHRWVVEDLCSQCAVAGSATEATDEVLPAATPAPR